jgi:hypothetical protein
MAFHGASAAAFCIHWPKPHGFNQKPPAVQLRQRAEGVFSFPQTIDASH